MVKKSDLIIEGVPAGTWRHREKVSCERKLRSVDSIKLLGDWSQVHIGNLTVIYDNFERSLGLHSRIVLQVCASIDVIRSNIIWVSGTHSDRVCGRIKGEDVLVDGRICGQLDNSVPTIGKASLVTQGLANRVLTVDHTLVNVWVVNELGHIVNGHRLEYGIATRIDHLNRESELLKYVDCRGLGVVGPEFDFTSHSHCYDSFKCEILRLKDLKGLVTCVMLEEGLFTSDGHCL